MNNSNLSDIPRVNVLRLFVISWAGMLCLAAWLAHAYLPASSVWLWLSVVALILLFTLARPVVVLPLYLFVDRLLRPIGKLSALLVFAIVYYLIFTIFSLVLRLVGWDPLQLKLFGKDNTGWTIREKRKPAADCFWQY